MQVACELSSPYLTQLVTKRITSDAEAIEELHRMHKDQWDLGSCESVKISDLTLTNNTHYLVIGAHHISLDGYSLAFSSLI